MNDLRQWLADQGFEQYAVLFGAHQIDLDALPGLNEQDLRELKIPIGDRKRLLRAIAELASDVAARQPRPVTERRQLTLMFCDLVDSTKLAERLDPEDMETLLGAFRTCVTETVGRFGGYLAAFIGDGVLVYFGYPQAHEDDAERSIRTGLGILDAVAGIGNRSEPRMQVRIGLATGMVVVGSIGGAEKHGVVGSVPNLAARLQTLAQPGWVVVSDETRRLAGAQFDYRDLGEQPLKGFSKPVHAWRVLGERRWESRFRAAHTAVLTPMVDRVAEMRLLQDRWVLASQGSGQVVFMEGEPGIGKSRLAEALYDWVRATSPRHHRMQWQCSPLYRDTALYPVLRWLEQAAGFAAGDTPRRRFERLEALLSACGPVDPRTRAFLCDMLSIPIGKRSAGRPIGRRAKDEGLRGLAAYVTAAARRLPLLLVVEDLHWIDPTTRELLGILVDVVAAAPVLLLATHRPEFRPPSPGPSQLSARRLERLEQADVGALVAGLARDTVVPAELLLRIEEKTDGIPLFVEELTKVVIESGWLAGRGDADAPPMMDIPSTLRDSLMARLDRLQAAKEVAQVGAAIGREFSYELVAAVSRIDRMALRRGLQGLLDAELIRRSGPGDGDKQGMGAEREPQGEGGSFAFRHTLVQEAAYESLLKVKRQKLHERIAMVIEERFPARQEQEPELLAHHYTAAERPERALGYWIRAAQNAAARWALPEAINHWHRALAMIGTQPASDERDRLELTIRAGLGNAYLLLKGWAAQEIRETLAPAPLLAERLGDLPSLFQVLRGLWTYHLTRAEHGASLKLVEQMLSTAQASGDDGVSVTAFYAAAASHFMTGDLDGARDYGDKVLKTYDAERHQNIVWALNTDPRCSTLLWASYWLWLLGRPDAALRAAEERDVHARRLGHPFNLCFDLTVGAAVFALRGEPEQMLRRIDEAMAVAHEQHLPLVTGLLGPLYKAAALIELDQAEESLRVSQPALAAWQGSGGRLKVPMHLGVQARALMRLGRHGEAAARIEAAFALVEDSQERWVEPELWRLKACLQLHAGERDEAFASLRRSLGTARRQGALSWELRAAMTLGEQLAEGERRPEARVLVGGCYARFSEGHDTADLRRARGLLDAWA